MKVKTSITLSEEILKELEKWGEAGQNRSELIEEAVRLFLQGKIRKKRDHRDLKILNERFHELNDEAEDVLTYQVDL